MCTTSIEKKQRDPEEEDTVDARRIASMEPWRHALIPKALGKCTNSTRGGGGGNG